MLLHGLGKLAPRSVHLDANWSEKLKFTMLKFFLHASYFKTVESLRKNLLFFSRIFQL